MSHSAPLALAAAATLLVARAPVEFALASVFLFAGPHNRMEFRYAVARLPSRLVPFRDFFVVAVTELFAPAAECALFAWEIAPAGSAVRWRRRDLVAIVLANALSFGSGVVLLGWRRVREDAKSAVAIGNTR